MVASMINLTFKVILYQHDCLNLLLFLLFCTLLRKIDAPVKEVNANVALQVILQM